MMVGLWVREAYALLAAVAPAGAYILPLLSWKNLLNSFILGQVVTKQLSTSCGIHIDELGILWIVRFWVVGVGLVWLAPE